MKPKPKGASARNPKKRCYELAGRAVLFDDTGRLALVHGVRYVNDDFPYAHAWVYDPSDDTIFDTTDQRWYGAAEYPGSERVRYSQRECCDRMFHSDDHGPWTQLLNDVEIKRREPADTLLRQLRAYDREP